jgi:hypothetical protein
MRRRTRETEVGRTPISLRPSLHTLCQDGFWVNERSDGSLASKHLSQTKAIQTGREIAKRRRLEHVIHDEAGEVVERESYAKHKGHDLDAR